MLPPLKPHDAARPLPVPASLQGVNTTRFDPAVQPPFEDLAAGGELVFGSPWAEKVAAGKRRSERPFRFVSTFKWEPRKARTPRGGNPASKTPLLACVAGPPNPPRPKPHLNLNPT
jgi:hypothetical protein